MTLHVPLAGSYSSALVSGPLVLLNPPVTSTLPFGSNVVVCPRRAMLRLPVALQFALAGSYTSVLLIESPLPSSPCHQHSAVG